MRCYICNSILEDDKVEFNSDHGDIDPCPSCQSVIDDILAGYEGPTAEDYDDVAPLLEGLFPTTYDPSESS